MKYAVTINGDNTTGMISQSVLCENDRGIVNGLSISLINTRDAQVREALIKLGWTPPNEQKEK